MWEGEGTDAAIDEMCDTIIAFCIEYMNEQMDIDEGEKTRLLIDIAEILLHKLLLTYPAIQPLDCPVELLNSIIEDLEERRTMLLARPSGIMN